MHISAPTDEFRTAAEAVRITVQEMRLMEREKGIWRLPATLREEKPQLYSLLNMYNKTMYDDIIERVANRGLRMEFDGALEVLFVQSRLLGQQHRTYVAIVIPHPLEGHSPSPTNMTGAHEDESIGEEWNPTKRRLWQSESDSTDTPPARKQKMAHQKHGKEALEGPKVLDEPPSSTQIDAIILRQQPEVLITSRFKTLPIGTIIELEDGDALHLKTGGIAVVLMRYRVQKLAEDPKNPEAKDQGRSSPI